MCCVRTPSIHDGAPILCRLLPATAGSRCWVEGVRKRIAGMVCLEGGSSTPFRFCFFGLSRTTRMLCVCVFFFPGDVRRRQGLKFFFELIRGTRSKHTTHRHALAAVLLLLLLTSISEPVLRIGRSSQQVLRWTVYSFSSRDYAEAG